MKRTLVGLLLLAGLVSAAPAQADVVNNFTFALKDIKPDGRYTVVFSSQSYDTTGAVPPLLVRNYIRIPVGATIPRAFVGAKNKKQLCDVTLLKQVKQPSACKNASIGTGTAKVDARLVVNPDTGKPYVADLIPYNLDFFLAKPQVPGAAASFVIFASPDLNSPVVNSAGIIRDTKVALVANFFNDPTPDGRFGYRLEIPAGPVQGFRVSVAEVAVWNPGQTITKTKVTCKKKLGGKCVKKSVKKTKQFWFTRPKCPPSNQLPFQSFYQYENGLAQTQEVTVPCPAFKS